MHQFHTLFVISSFLSLIILSTTSFIQAQNSPQDFVNIARTEVGVSPITWDPTVAAFAENYVSGRLADCIMVHSNNSYGENLAHGTNLTGQKAVRKWIEEKADYDPRSNTCVVGTVCSHYTQVVWRDTVRLGCARAQCADGLWFVSCNYDPPGNFNGPQL